MARLREDVRRVLTLEYCVCVAIIVIIGYSFSLTNGTMDGDDRAITIYMGRGGLIGTGRWSGVVLLKMMGLSDFYPCIDGVIGIILLVLAAVCFYMLFARCSDYHLDHKTGIIFSCLFLSYPLINEIWNYFGLPIKVAGGYLMVAIVLLFLTSNYKWKIPFSVFLLAIISSNYESACAVYVLGVFIVILLEMLYGSKKYGIKEIFQRGCSFAIVLFAGIALSELMGFIIRATLNIPRTSWGNTNIIWGNGHPIGVLKGIVVQIFCRYFFMSMWYLPLTILVFSIIISMFIAVYLFLKKRNKGIILMFLGMYIALFLIPIVKGYYAGYRTDQTFALFTAFVFMLLYQVVTDACPVKCIKNVVMIIGVALCFEQAVYLSKLFILNYLRSEEEIQVVKTVGYELEQMNTQQKPVVFVGDYEINSNIISKISMDSEGLRWKMRTDFPIVALQPYIDKLPLRYVETNIMSVLKWGIGAFREREEDPLPFQVVLIDLFQYYGFEVEGLKENPEEIYFEAENYAAENMERYPKAGYIHEMEDYIIVKLGNN